MAVKLGIRVVAEGVETVAQAEHLRAFGCTLGQGYLFSRPVDRQTVTRLLVDKAQKQDPDLAPRETTQKRPMQAPDSASAPQRVARYAVLLCEGQWRVVSERRQFGRFPTRAAAFQCALRLAGEATAAGVGVELLHADAGGELRAFQLTALTGPI